MIISLGNYRIKKYQNDICWYVEEKRKVKKKDTGRLVTEWVRLECYPTSLSNAVNITCERIFLTSKKRVQGIGEVVDAVKDMKAEILEKVKVEMEKGDE